MTRTPDEIKKGLECCGESQDCTQDNMPKCPYYEKETCLTELVNDSLALIQQLQEEVSKYEEGYDALTKIIKRLEAERDAAVEDLETVCGMFMVCHACKDRFWGGDSCRGCVNSNHWQWRGVQKEE